MENPCARLRNRQKHSQRRNSPVTTGRPEIQSHGGPARIFVKPGQPARVENFFRPKHPWWVSQLFGLHLCQSRGSSQESHRERVFLLRLPQGQGQFPTLSSQWVSQQRHLSRLRHLQVSVLVRWVCFQWSHLCWVYHLCSVIKWVFPEVPTLWVGRQLGWT